MNITRIATLAVLAIAMACTPPTVMAAHGLNAQARKVAPKPPKAPVAPKDGAADVTVSVNTDSGIYHMSGCRWYGTTKHTKMMKMSEAKKAGYRVCSKCGR